MKLAPVIERLNDLPSLARFGIVIGGYVIAIMVAMSVLAAHVSVTSVPDRDASSGMHAFGDALLFIFVFGAASVAPTGLALYFLRAARLFWWFVCLVAFAVAMTGLRSVMSVADFQSHASESLWSALAVPRIFVAPLLAALFAVSGMFAPCRMHRWGLFAASGIECAISVFGFVHWLLPIIFTKG